MAPYLKRRYGFFRCSSCRKQWESSHVYGNFAGQQFQVQYGQECKTCRIMVKPYRTEPIVCRVCGVENCICVDKRRNTDASRPHRSDLCGKCRAGLPCQQSWRY